MLGLHLCWDSSQFSSGFLFFKQQDSWCQVLGATPQFSIRVPHDALWSHTLSKMLTGLQLLCGNQMLHRATTNMSRWWEAQKLKLRSQMRIVLGFLLCKESRIDGNCCVFIGHFVLPAAKLKYVLRLTYCHAESLWCSQDWVSLLSSLCHCALSQLFSDVVF